jgi:hypothetical protein
MPLLPSNVHVDQALTNISVAFAQEQTRFVASQAFPNIPVSKLTDKYFIFDKGNYLRSIADLRAPGAPTRGANYTLSTGIYDCREYGVHSPLDDLIVGNADPALNIEVSTTTYITEQLLMKRDSVFANTAFTNGVWKGSSKALGADIETADLSSGDWDTSGSAPIFDILREIAAVEAKTGRRPNVLILGKDVYRALSTNADILDRIKYTQTGVVTTDLLAGLFGLDKVVVPGAIQNSAAEGLDDSMSYIFDPKNAALLYVPSSPGLMTPSAGYMFSFTGVGGGNALGFRVKNYRKEEIHSQVIEALAAFDFKIVSDELGVFFLGVVS